VKTVEVRRWAPHPDIVGEKLAIHAGLRYDRVAPLAVQRVAGGATARLGGIVGVARLVEVIEFTEERWRKLAGEHLNPLEWWEEGLQGWRFEEARPIEPMVRTPGRLGFWALPDVVRTGVSQAVSGGA
jgi:hypothetical protein